MKSEGSFSGAGLFAHLPQVFGRALDFVLPPTCFGCAVEVEEQGGLCPSCWSGLHFISNPYCKSCGFPFAHDMPDGVLCASCHSDAPGFDGARAALAYNAESRPLVLAFKHGGRSEGLKTMAKWLKAATSDFLDEVDLIIPVPLHGMKLFRRKFNQSAWLADALSAECGIPSDSFILKRVKNTRTQGGLSRHQREKNVRAAFRVAEDALDRVKGRQILLVDDVLTTGATVENCTKALKKAGADIVYIGTLARVVEPLRRKK